MTSSILHHYLQEFRDGRDLGAADGEVFFNALIAEQDEAVLSNVLLAWNEKDVTDDELFSIATVMRNRMKRVNSSHAVFVDAVGTGGSRAKTFNVSTAAAFVIAGAGVPVAKHGNRAATSNTGSADVLSLLGINIDAMPETAERCLNELGIC